MAEGVKMENLGKEILEEENKKEKESGTEVQHLSVQPKDDNQSQSKKQSIVERNNRKFNREQTIEALVNTTKPFLGTNSYGKIVTFNANGDWQKYLRFSEIVHHFAEIKGNENDGRNQLRLELSTRLDLILDWVQQVASDNNDPYTFQLGGHGNFVFLQRIAKKYFNHDLVNPIPMKTKEKRKRKCPVDEPVTDVKELHTEADTKHVDESERVFDERKEESYAGRGIDVDTGRGFTEEIREGGVRGVTKSNNDQFEDARLRRLNELLEKSKQLEQEEKDLELEIQLFKAQQRVKELRERKRF